MWEHARDRVCLSSRRPALGKGGTHVVCSRVVADAGCANPRVRSDLPASAERACRCLHETHHRDFHTAKDLYYRYGSDAKSRACHLAVNKYLNSQRPAPPETAYRPSLQVFVLALCPLTSPP